MRNLHPQSLLDGDRAGLGNYPHMEIPHPDPKLFLDVDETRVGDSF